MFPGRVIRSVGVTAALGASLAFAVPASAAEAGPPPANDAQAAAIPLARVPVTVYGTTAGATADPKDQQACDGTEGAATVWYLVPAETTDRRLVITVDVGGNRDVAVAVFARVRSELQNAGCAPSDQSGQANFPLEQTHGWPYLIAISPRGDSPPGPFRLRLRPVASLATPPGRRLPAGGAWSSLDPLFQTDAAWHVTLTEGRTYRLAIWASPGRTGECARVDLFRPPVRGFTRPATSVSCRGYTLLTPRTGQTGRWVVRVSTSFHAAPRFLYHLQIAPALADDSAPGLRLANHATVRGSLAARGIDRVDLYWFSLRNRSELGAQVVLPESAQADLVLLSEHGRTLGCSCESSGTQSLTRLLEPGRYFLAVRARGVNGFAYALTRAAREVTATTMTVNGVSDAAVLPGVPVTLAATVTPVPSGGTVLMTLERFDPLQGWLFVRRIDAGVTAGRASITLPPLVQSRYRVAASFLGTFDSSPSRATTSFLIWPPLGT
jgi:hypothetical protein